MNKEWTLCICICCSRAVGIKINRWSMIGYGVWTLDCMFYKGSSNATVLNCDTSGFFVFFVCFCICVCICCRSSWWSDKKNRWSLIGFDLWWTSEYHCGSRHIIFVFVFVYVFVSVFVFLLLFLMLKKPQMVNDQLWSVVDAGV